MSTWFTQRLARLDALIEREVLRMRARYQLSLDEFRGLYISDEQVDQLIRAARSGGSNDAPGPGPSLVAAESADPRWRQLGDAFDLSSTDLELIFIAAAPELDAKYETLYAYLNNDVTRKWPTADLASRLLSELVDGSQVVGALAPKASLHSKHLIRRIAAPGVRPALTNEGYGLHPAVTYWLHGHSPALALDAAAINWLPAKALTAGDEVTRERAAPIVRLLNDRATARRSLPAIALLGEPGSGRASSAMTIAACAGRSIARIDLRTLPSDLEALGPILETLTVALRLEPAVVLLEGFEPATGEEHRGSTLTTTMRRTLGERQSSTLLALRTSEDERWRPYVQQSRCIELRCDADRLTDRVATWRDAARLHAVDVADPDLRGVAGRFVLAPGQVRATLATARDLATMAGESVGSEHLSAAARLASDQSLGRLATKVERKHDWSELVLPSATLTRLKDLAAAIRQRQVVYGEWGFGSRLITGIGIKALFAGASGTGKTMAAGVIARELGLDLYKIDLSGVVSKYIGETEKNLDRIFRAARAANAILFLDEAEALMGKRSEVKDAHDRYANIEVAYLLQKLEEHEGIVILATNLKRNIDDAFSRRMQYVIDFPRPEAGEREKIWRGMFPETAPVASDVDFGFLAKQFELAGGDIRNVVLDAAFLAVEDGGTIRMPAIIEALARQLSKQGKTPTGAEFRQYQTLLQAHEGRRRDGNERDSRR